MLFLISFVVIMMVFADAEHPLGIIGHCDIANKEVLDVMFV